MAESKEYNASSIKALDQHSHLLKRLSLIFGSVEAPGESFSSQKGVALREILDNALDEVRAGYGTHVRLSIFKDRSVEIQDSGRGIPVDAGVNADGSPASGIYLALGVLQSGGKFETDSKRFSSGLNGLGGSASIHVSRRADITVYRNNKKYELSFKDGEPGFFAEDNNPDSEFTPLEDLTYVKQSKDSRSPEEKKNYKTGTTVKLWLRDEVFSSQNPYDDQDLVSRLKLTAFLVPQMYAEVYNELKEIENPETGVSSPQTEEYHFPNGIEDLVELIQPDTKIHELIHINTVGKYVEKNVAVLQADGSVKNQDLHREVPIEIAFRYGDKYETTVETFVNTIQTKLNGVHLTAFERALTNTFTERFQSMRGILGKKEEPPIPEDFLEGLTAVISVQVSEPTFTSQSKEALSGREVQKAIQDSLSEYFTNFVNDKDNYDTVQIIAKKVVAAAKNRQKAREQRDLARAKNKISSSSLPISLIDCLHSGSEDAELYICEGQSALGSLKAARDGSYNALLPIRGKIINAHKEQLKKVLANKEVQDIIKTLGAGSGSDFNIDNMRYGRVLIAVDADPDGNAIACLLYALFWHLFRPVIQAGKLYKVETPLFVVQTQQGKKSRKLYAQDEQDRDRIMKNLDKQNVKYLVTRLKGLGEVNADVLAETAINPETRIITQISLDDVEKATNMLDMLLGNDAGARKTWIESTEVDEDLLGE